MIMVSNSVLVDFLKEQNVDAGFLANLKNTYRPLICPFDELLEHIPGQSRVFDIGCGSGQFCLLVAQFTAASSVEGIEIRDDLVQNARRFLAPYQAKISARFTVFDGKTLPPELVTADRVFMIDVLHHIPRKLQLSFLESVFKGMKSGAQFILKDIDGAHPMVIFNKLHDLLLSHEIGAECSASDTKKKVQEIGFRLISENKRRLLWYPHFTLILGKP